MDAPENQCPHCGEGQRVKNGSALRSSETTDVTPLSDSNAVAREPSGRKGEWRSSEPVVVGEPGPVFEPDVVRPEYWPSPFRGDTVIDGWQSRSFVVRAASIRGYSHRYYGEPRQDDFAVMSRAGGDQLLVAVADGVSSAGQSHVGSTVAVRYGIKWLSDRMGDPTEETDWEAFVGSTAWALVEHAAAVFGIGKTAEDTESLMATTMICAVVDADPGGGAVVHTIGVGDSGAWILSEEGFRRVEGGKEATADGISTSAVVGLPRIPAGVKATVARIESGEVLLLGTDGFGDPLGSGSGQVGRLFSEALGGGRIPSMIEFAHKLDFLRETFDDDRTLVAVWPRSGATGQSPALL